MEALASALEPQSEDLQTILDKENPTREETSRFCSGAITGTLGFSPEPLPEEFKAILRANFEAIEVMLAEMGFTTESHD